MTNDLISPEYRDQLQELHFTRDDWGTTGAKWLGEIANIVHAKECDSILDYGCGKAVLLYAMRRTFPALPVLGYDPGVSLYDALPAAPMDLVVCTDVLEHIEPEYIDNVLDHIRDLTKKVAFLVISTRRAKAILPDGRNAHLIIEGPEYWIDKVSTRFRTIDARIDDARSEVVIRALK